MTLLGNSLGQTVNPSVVELGSLKKIERALQPTKLKIGTASSAFHKIADKKVLEMQNEKSK
jgi:hypothetical protein